jgi:hypothetical protein
VYLHSFFNLVVKVAKATPWPLSRERDPVRIVQEAGWDPLAVWTRAEILAFTGIRSPVRPAHSQSLYLLSHSGPLQTLNRALNHNRQFRTELQHRISRSNSYNQVAWLHQIIPHMTSACSLSSQRYVGGLRCISQLTGRGP